MDTIFRSVGMKGASISESVPRRHLRRDPRWPALALPHHILAVRSARRWRSLKAEVKMIAAARRRHDLLCRVVPSLPDRLGVLAERRRFTEQSQVSESFGGQPTSSTSVPITTSRSLRRPTGHVDPNPRQMFTSPIDPPRRAPTPWFIVSRTSSMLHTAVHTPIARSAPRPGRRALVVARSGSVRSNRSGDRLHQPAWRSCGR